MYQINIENFGGCKSAVMNVDQISLLVGRNADGKSSVCDAVAAALAGGPGPLGITKADAGQVVRAGSDVARVTVAGKLGTIKATFPDCSFTPDGEQSPTASVYATGRQSVLDMKETDKAAALQQYLKTLPTAQDLAAALKRFKIDADTMKSVWQRIDDKGWDAALNHYKEQGAALKGQWKQATGHPGNYGSDIASKWLPKGWEQDLEGVSLETLVDETAREKEMLESLLKYEAVNEKEISDLQEVYLGLDQAQKDHAEHVKLLATRKQEVVDADKALGSLRRPEKEQTTVPCPHCDKPLVIANGKVEKPRVKALDADEIAKMQAALDAATETLSKARQAVNWEQSAIAESQQRMKAAEAADVKLKEIAAREKEAPTGDQVERQRKAVERAESRHQAAVKKRSADAINDSIVRNQFVIDVLKPEGLRAEKLTNALKEFNEKTLQPLCEAARYGDMKWGDVEIQNDLKIVFANRAKRLSKSEKFRLRVTLQVAFALIDDSDMLVIDEADILDANGRSGLISMLQIYQIPALVAMTVSKDDEVPNLAEHGLGTTYIFNDGHVVQEVKLAEAVA